ncbi:MAG: IS4 family transposase [Pleurocapsa sp. SU_196_0]|nr:IS4 family transposase [Pleurocapsa sp. SU_196_0]
MTKIPQLAQALSAPIHFDPRILEFIARFILALLEKRSVNLAVLGNTLNEKVKSESNQRRATRFLARDQTWRDALRDWLLGFFPDHITLAVDRTEWTFGNTPINLLVIAIVYNGFAIPLIWTHLGKAGSSNAREVTTLLDTLASSLAGRTVLVLMDREFANHRLLVWLTRVRWDFDLRLKRDARVSYRDHTARVECFFKDWAQGYGTWLKRRVTVYGVKVFVVAFHPLVPTEDGDDCLYVLTNRAPSAAASRYSTRWSIENLFSALKSRGFNLEDTYLTHALKLENLLGLLCLAVFWAVRVGEFISSLTPVKRKGHGRLAVSVFRLGLDALERVFRFDVPSLKARGLVWDDALRLLSGT